MGSGDREELHCCQFENGNNIPGIYAAGDICTYEGKVKLIACRFW